MKIEDAFKSRTINFNTWVSLGMMVASKFGYGLSPDDIVTIYGFGNIILRFLTDKPIGGSK